MSLRIFSYVCEFLNSESRSLWCILENASVVSKSVLLKTSKHQIHLEALLNELGGALPESF